MNKFALKVLRNLAVSAIPAIAFLSGCTTDIDDDAFRAGAIKIEIDEVTSDEIYPSAGDEIDWKMVFVPTPGDITVNTFWDDPTGVFNVVVGIYDRFGIPIKVERRDVASDKLEVTGFTPESGLHYVKVQAESGRSIYSINIKFQTNYDGFVALEKAPDYVAYSDFEAEVAANAAAAKDGSKGAAGGLPGAAGGLPGAAGGVPGGAPAAPAGAVVLPAAGAGGAVVLPTAAAGGISSSGGQTGPTVVRESGGGRSFAAAEVRQLSQKTSAVSNESDEIKPIVADIRGKYKKIEAEVMSVTDLKKGTKFKINVGRAQGVRKGAVGEIYVGGELLEGGRFKITSIMESGSFAETNARSKDVKKASKIIVKIPE